MDRVLADIALPIPLRKTFTYIVPPDLQPRAKPGSRVLVSFGKKVLTGIIVGFPASTQVSGLKPLRDVLDATPSLSTELLRLTQWISEYYFASWGEVLKAATPQGIARASRAVVKLRPINAEAALSEVKTRAPKQYAILRILVDEGESTVARLQKKTSARSIHGTLLAMEQRGWIVMEEEVQQPKTRLKKEKIVELTALAGIVLAEKNGSTTVTPRQRILLQELQGVTGAGSPVSLSAFLRKTGASSSAVTTLKKKGLVAVAEQEVVRVSGNEYAESLPDIKLNAHQDAALAEITKAVGRRRYETFLLHGVTGSGKTQVYIEAIRNVLKLGQTAIVLVPEISLTPQTVRRFKAHFSSDVTVMHSQMSAGERFDAWRLAHEGRVKIVIGPRSAIFAPLGNVGLIVVDEEHEGSYKQYDAIPRYNARDVAIVRAVQTNAVVVLGSATPSAESYYNAVSGKYRLLELPERVDNARMPAIELVDMAVERRRRFEAIKAEVTEKKSEFPKHIPQSSVSRLLHDQIEERLKKKEGVIILQNRRGFSHVVECFECGYVERCDNCDVPLTYHVTKKHLRCHYCGSVRRPPVVCPKCGSKEIRFYSFGTQQVHEELEELFPDAVILRMDRDTTSRKGAHDRILRQFGEGEADILLGTQMVAKGLDFPRVTLVGVISADTQMLLPDFRASEHTFQLLTQVAGRAGRSALAGEVVIQTLQPDHYCLKHVVSHDFAGFYKEELEYRKELDYPPFSRIVLLEFAGKRENEAQHHAKTMMEFVLQEDKKKSFLVLGPADAAIPKIRNQFRKHLIIKDLKSKDPSALELRSALGRAVQRYEASPLGRSGAVRLTVDVDPQGMM